MADDVIYAMARLHVDMEPAVITLKRHYIHDDEFVSGMMNALDRNSYDAVFSVHYFHLISYCCHEKGIPYICYEYDSPVSIINSEYFNFDTNYIFLFDRANAERCRRSGFDRVFHMPLAVDTGKYDRIILSDEDRIQMSSDVSFVGQLYPDEFTKAVNLLDDYTKAYLIALCEVQLNIYGKDILSGAITSQIMDTVNNRSGFLNAGSFNFFRDAEGKCGMTNDMMEFFMQKYISRRERLLVLSLLAKHFDTRLYSGDTHEILENVKQMGYADYEKTMPKVFKASKVNLNITLRTIETGIPLRCFDIMGCGGFLLSNYQEEFYDYFDVGRELVIYESIEDAYEKTDYYLSHDDERKQIAADGYRAVKERFSFDGQLKKIFAVADLPIGGQKE